MSEFELVEAFYLVRAGLESSFITISTGIFAYVVVSHFAGKELSSMTAAMITTIYSLFLLGPVGARFVEFDRWRNIVLEHLERFPDGIMFDGSPPPLMALQIVGQAPLFLAWGLSMYYFHFVIRRKALNRDDGT